MNGAGADAADGAQSGRALQACAADRYFAEPAHPALRPLAASLARLTDPAVRDLAWLLFSADLLRAQPVQASLAEPWTDVAEAEAVAQWLVSVDHDPAPLHAAFANSPVKRLGRYAELLLGWFLSHGPAARLVAASLPLRREGLTLGECDFLVEASDGRRLHWELAVKCYLHAGAGPQAGLADFVGPNLRDRLDRKYRHLLDHQLRLTEREEFASLGYRGPWAAQMFVKGWLFYRAGVPGPAQDPGASALAPGHARGWWVTRAEWTDFAAQQAADGWSVLPRLAWLAPRRIGASAVPAVAAPVDAATLVGGLPREDEPVMVAAFQADDVAAGNPRRYVERSRGFIVPDDWPERARTFALGGG